jgi:hypothetical protein
MRFAWVCLAVALAAGCETGTGGNQLGICSTVCRCAAGGLPSEQDACVEQCLGFPSFFVTPLCETCVFENASSCVRMEQECFENGLCDGRDPPEPDPGPDPAPPR